MKKIFISLVVALSLFSFFNKTDASSLFLKSSKENVSIGEQFYVDVLLDPEGDNINGIESALSFDNNIFKLIRIEDYKSMVDLWVDKPIEKSKGTIRFSGIITNGFSGVIDPFNLNEKLPGNILRIILEPISFGKTNISSSETSINLNDGSGTSINIDNSILTIDILDSQKDIFIPVNYSVPVLDFEIVKEKELYDNKYVIIFNARDEGSGIKEVLIKEGIRRWKAIESPHLLKDQSRSSRIILKAVNLNGEYTELTIDPSNKNYKKIIILVLTPLVLLILFLLFKRHLYGKENKFNKN